MEATARREVNLHKRVGEELKAIGYPGETIPADQQPVLSGGFKPGAIIPEGVEEFVLGKEPETYVGVTHSGPLSRMVDWIRRKKRK